MIVTTGGRVCSVSSASTSSSASISTSASDTRLRLWPNSVTSSSAVSWSIVWLTVTGMPILNSALTRSAPRSAMRLASSPTVIVSGTTTSRTCLADGPPAWCARLSFSRLRLSAASERARAPSPSSSALVTVSLPDWRRSSTPLPRAGRAGGSGRFGETTGVKRRGGGIAGRRRLGLGLGRGGGIGRGGGLGRTRRLRRGAARRGASGAGAGAAGGRLRRWRRLVLGAQLLLGAAALLLDRLDLLALLAAARFLERVHPRLVGLAQQALLLLAPLERRQRAWRRGGARRRARGRGGGAARGAGAGAGAARRSTTALPARRARPRRAWSARGGAWSRRSRCSSGHG